MQPNLNNPPLSNVAKRRINPYPAEGTRAPLVNQFGSDGGDGMDAWQTSVEKRLDSLDGRVGRMDDRLGKVEVSLATLVERVAHLPGKGFVVTSAVSTVMAITGLLVLLQKVGVLH